MCCKKAAQVGDLVSRMQAFLENMLRGVSELVLLYERTTTLSITANISSESYPSDWVKHLKTLVILTVYWLVRCGCNSSCAFSFFSLVADFKLSSFWTSQTTSMSCLMMEGKNLLTLEMLALHLAITFAWQQPHPGLSHQQLVGLSSACKRVPRHFIRSYFALVFVLPSLVKSVTMAGSRVSRSLQYFPCKSGLWHTNGQTNYSHSSELTLFLYLALYFLFILT